MRFLIFLFFSFLCKECFAIPARSTATKLKPYCVKTNDNIVTNFFQDQADRTNSEDHKSPLFVYDCVEDKDETAHETNVSENKDIQSTCEVQEPRDTTNDVQVEEVLYRPPTYLDRSNYVVAENNRKQNQTKESEYQSRIVRFMDPFTLSMKDLFQVSEVNANGEHETIVYLGNSFEELYESIRVKGDEIKETHSETVQKVIHPKGRRVYEFRETAYYDANRVAKINAQLVNDKGEREPVVVETYVTKMRCWFVDPNDGQRYRVLVNSHRDDNSGTVTETTLTSPTGQIYATTTYDDAEIAINFPDTVSSDDTNDHVFSFTDPRNFNLLLVTQRYDRDRGYTNTTVYSHMNSNSIVTEGDDLRDLVTTKNVRMYVPRTEATEEFILKTFKGHDKRTYTETTWYKKEKDGSSNIYNNVETGATVRNRGVSRVIHFTTPTYYRVKLKQAVLMSYNNALQTYNTYTINDSVSYQGQHAGDGTTYTIYVTKLTNKNARQPVHRIYKKNANGIIEKQDILV